MTSSTAKKNAEELTTGYGLPEDALALLREEVAWALDIAESRGRVVERAAVVAWLRARGVEIENWPPGGRNEISLTYNIIADEIERGEHRREEE